MIVLGRDAGIPKLACLGGFHSDRDRADRDVLWFPSASGLVRIEPARVAAAFQAPVRVYLESIWSRGLLLHQLRGVLPASGADAAAPFELGVRTRPVEFHFGAAALGRDEPPQFTCRMSGLDEDWSAVGAGRSISYPALPAGRYQFQVAIPPECGGTDQTRAAIDLIVRPVFWQTAWFYGLMLLASSGLAVVLARGVLRRRYQRRMLELRREQALQLERTRIARDMHDRIGAGLTSLAMVSDLAQAEGDFPPAANEEFNRIFHLARELTGSLDEIVWAVNPANDTLNDLVAYLVGMVTEYLEALPTRLCLDVPGELPSMNISSRERHELCLTVKEALANAIKHARASQITFKVRWLEGELRVAVADDGQGFDPDRPEAAASGQDGLRNMRARMDAIGGRIEIQSHPGQGTRVALSLKMMTPDRVKRMVS